MSSRSGKQLGGGAGMNGSGGSPTRRCLPRLRELNANHVDAVFAENQGGIKFLRDVQSWRVFLNGLQRMLAKDLAHRALVRTSHHLRRRTFPLEIRGEVGRNEDYLPGKGRRNSLLLTAYEPAAKHLRERVEQACAVEAEAEEAVASAMARWGLKSIPDYFDSEDDHPEDGSGIGVLNVSGLPLLKEDIEVIANILRNNHGFTKLDLSRCFISDEHFVCLAQALAWNVRVEEVRAKECIFTNVIMSALADVITVNHRIRAIDIRRGRGLNKERLEHLLWATRDNLHLEKINGMELATLRKRDSHTLNLRRWGLGYVESVIIGHYIQQRADGLQYVDFRDNEISTEAFSALMIALRNQSRLRSLDLSKNQIDERALVEIEELLQRNEQLVEVDLTHNRVSCSEFEPFGLLLMNLLSGNNMITVFHLEGNDVAPKMLAIISAKLAANRAVRRDTSMAEFLRFKYPRITHTPIVADSSKLHLEYADTHFMCQENILPMRTTVYTDRRTIPASQGSTAGVPLDLFFFARKRSKDVHLPKIVAIHEWARNGEAQTSRM